MKASPWYAIPLRPFSWIYGLAIALRNWCYDVHVFRIQKMTVPVISIGNLTAGGTGKTPIVEYVIDYLQRSGKHPAVISRGYKRTTSGTFVVSDGTTCYGRVEETGDEPMQIARKYPGVVVVVDERRSRGAAEALRRKNVDLILLDDGFKHRALARDLDVVVLDGSDPIMHQPMIPAGTRREPFSALHRAGVVIVTREPVTDELKSFVQKHTAASIISVTFKPKSLTDRRKMLGIPKSALNGQKCIAFCGIGNPRSFVLTLEEFGIQPLDVVIFPDHRHYSTSDIRTIINRANSCHATLVLTTEKDAVRFDTSLLSGIPESLQLCSLTIEPDIVEGKDSFHNLLDAVMRRAA